MQIFTLFLIYTLSLLVTQETKNPHGPDFKLSCNLCHSPDGWYLDKKNYSFNHNTTKMPLAGQHVEVNCRQCHKSLVFKEAIPECNACHQDIHQATVGFECSRCHTPASWLVSNITEIHMLGRFPLLGAHKTADCRDCHKSESSVRFDAIGVNCVDCHREEYKAAKQPDHIQAGFSENCITCHSINAFEWAGAGFNHNFFPLTGGHSQPSCLQCHTGGNYTSLSRECYLCHKSDYDNTVNPKHTSLGFPVTCEICHTLDPGWKPASYKDHDNKSFPIYSGKHKGEWSACTDCHTNSSSWTVFSCINCHEHNKSATDSHHNEVRNYTYDSNACYRCHPRGTGGD